MGQPLGRVAGGCLVEGLPFDDEFVFAADAALEFGPERGGAVVGIVNNSAQEGCVALVVEGQAGAAEDVVIERGVGPVAPAVVMIFGQGANIHIGAENAVKSIFKAACECLEILVLAGAGDAFKF